MILKLALYNVNDKIIKPSEKKKKKIRIIDKQLSEVMSLTVCIRGMFTMLYVEFILQI